MSSLSSSFVEYVSKVAGVGRNQTYKVAHGGYCYSRGKVSKDNIEYYYCDNKSCKASIVRRNENWSYGKKYWNDDGTHIVHLPDKDRRAKEAALDRLQELTLSANGCRKAIEIVRQVRKEVSSDILAMMPNETSLLRRVRRIATKNNIRLLKSSPDDYNEDQTCSTSPVPSTSSNEVVKTGIVNTDPVSGIHNQEQSTGMVFLKEHLNSHCIAMLDGYQFAWKQNINREKFLYACREGTKGCSVSVIIDSVNSKYELRGTHSHESRTMGKKKPRPEWKILKRVDEDGNEIGAASLDDFLSGTTNWEDDDNNYNHEKQQNCGKPAVPATDFTVSTSNVSVNDETGDYHDDMHHDDCNDSDFQMDDTNAEQDPVPEAPLFKETKLEKTSSRVIATSSIPSTKKIQATRPFQKKAYKSGDRCFVCGDDLIVSETLSASSSETFKKACCYLNVKSETKWFPRASSKFFSFCESCTEEITKIHSLYRKVEEIQSLIFNKVESVEKRIADAEIVDNWMAEAPQTTAVRFEGFRKQVMINYRNKLKLRREIRFGNKTGQPLIEAKPGLSAHMFASDPAETDAFYKVPRSTPSKTVNGDSATAAPRRRTKGRPKSKKPPEEREPEPVPTPPDADPPTMFFDSPVDSPNDEDGFHNDFDDSQDAMSVTSEKEVKFWEKDPSTLKIVRQKNRKRRNSNDVGGDINNESDPDYNEDDDDDDEDWGNEKKKSKTKTPEGNAITVPGAIKRGRGRPRKDSKLPIGSEQVVSKPKPAKKQTKAKPKSSKPPDNNDSTKTRGRPRKQMMGEFPECVLTKDGRVFMQGIEIIKNPPGTYKPRPLQPSFSCGACGKIICGFWTIRMHICGHHLSMYKCPICQRECTDPRSLKSHIASVHDEGEREECPVCGKSIKLDTYKKTILYHRWMHLSAEEKKDPQYKSWQPQKERTPARTAHRQTFMCGQCAKTFANPATLKRHESIYHGDPSSLMCQYCGRILSNRKTLSRHVLYCAKKATGALTNRRYPCPKCPALFTFRTARAKHLRKLHGVSAATADLQYSCPKCPRKFSNRGGFRSHKRVCVDGEKGFSHKSRGGNDTQQPSSSTTSEVTRYSEFKVDPTESFLSPMIGQNQSFESANSASALGFNYNFLSNYSGTSGSHN